MSIARPYAAAAFAHAKASNALDLWATMFASLTSSVDAVRELVRANPGESMRIAESLLDILKIKDSGQINFLTVVAQNRRLEYVGDIAREFDELHMDDQGAAVMTVESAREMNKSAQKSFDEFLNHWSGRQVRTTYTQNSELLGGVCVYWRDNVLDASVRGRINRLAAALN